MWGSTSPNTGKTLLLQGAAKTPISGLLDLERKIFDPGIRMRSRYEKPCTSSMRVCTRQTETRLPDNYSVVARLVLTMHDVFAGRITSITSTAGKKILHTSTSGGSPPLEENCLRPERRRPGCIGENLFMVTISWENAPCTRSTQSRTPS